MPAILPLTILAGAAGLGVTLLAAAESPRRAAADSPPASAPGDNASPVSAAPRFFDPVLDGAALCGPHDNRTAPVHYSRKVAATTETRPFPPQPSDSAKAGADAPLFGNLGRLSYRVTTANANAQRYFDQGLRLAYGFNHAEALRAFRTAQKHDPSCAMCFWGEALVLGPNINAPMESAAVAPAVAAVKQASEKAGAAAPHEQALIAALAKRYSDDAKGERAPLDAAYAAAMGEVAARFPQDDNIQVLYAEALMDLSPWDYWEAGGAKPKGKTADILRALEGVLKRSPDHSGAIHYYIHMVEASDAPQRALPFARKLAATMPGAGHLVHMPFHIYYRVGDYRAAVDANKAAVLIDEAYIAREKPVGMYPMAYYLHNVHSLMTSAQMAGNGASAVTAAEKLARIVSEDAARAVPMAQPIAVAHYFAHAQFSAPAVVLALPAPSDDLPYLKAMWHYARGVAYAADKNMAAAREKTAAIERLATRDFAALTAIGIPAPDVIALARQVVLERIALANGQLPAARTAFKQA